MNNRNIIVCSLALIMLVLAFLLGFLAAQAFEDRVPAHSQQASLQLEPLPDWVFEPLPDFSSYQDTQARKRAFFEYLFPRIALANQRILTLRSQVERLAEKPTLSEKEEAFLAEQAERLRVDAPIGSPESFDTLFRRLDMVPPSLVMAQAANESAWGTSRFARQGNNLFGQWCFAEGCGLVPNSRPEGARHEVASFETPYQSVRSYLTNLNRHPRYSELREDRARARAENRMPTGPVLAAGLQAYSERGDEYIDEILSMIRFNELQRYDRRFSEWLEAEPGEDPPYVLLPNRQASAD